MSGKPYPHPDLGVSELRAGWEPRDVDQPPPPMTAQDPVEALATALRSRYGDHITDETLLVLAAQAIRNLPPGWRLVGPDAVVVSVEDVARRLYLDEHDYDAWDKEFPEIWEAYEQAARRLLGQEGE